MTLQKLNREAMKAKETYALLSDTKSLQLLFHENKSRQVPISKFSFEENRYNSRCGLVSFSLPGHSIEKCTFQEAEQESKPTRCALKNLERAVLVDARHRFVVLPELAQAKQCNTGDLIDGSMVFTKSVLAFMTRENVLQPPFATRSQGLFSRTGAL